MPLRQLSLEEAFFRSGPGRDAWVNFLKDSVNEPPDRAEACAAIVQQIAHYLPPGKTTTVAFYEALLHSQVAPGYVWLVRDVIVVSEIVFGKTYKNHDRFECLLEQFETYEGIILPDEETPEDWWPRIVDMILTRLRCPGTPKRRPRSSSLSTPGF